MAAALNPVQDRTELAYWYYQLGVHKAVWSTFDRTWTVGDEHGAAVGSVAFDPGIARAPEYWLRGADGIPLIGLAHAEGVLELLSDRWPRIVWPGGTRVGLFREDLVWWGQEAIGKWQVQIDVDGDSPSFAGAWMWDAADAHVASVTRVRKPEAGSYLLLQRSSGLSELLGWATLAFPLVVFQELFAREVQVARFERVIPTDLL